MTDIKLPEHSKHDFGYEFDPGIAPQVEEYAEAYAREAVRLNSQVDAKPMFWVRLCSDGCYEGPIHDSRIEDVRKQSGAWHPLYLAAPAAPQPRDDGMPASSDERHLRRLLASRVAMPNTYFDDGEAHGAEHGIQIDFMREPVAHIDAKLRALNVARLAVAAPQPAQSAGNHRPDRQWYEHMIQETLDDDFEIGPAFDEKVKDSAAPAAPQQPLTDEQFQKIRRSLMQQSGWDGDGWDQALKEAIEQAHRIGVKP